MVIVYSYHYFDWFDPQLKSHNLDLKCLATTALSFRGEMCDKALSTWIITYWLSFLVCMSPLVEALWVLTLHNWQT